MSIRGELMRINPVTRNTMSKMIANVRLNSVTDVSTVGKTEKIETQNNAMSTTSGELMKENFYDKLEKKEDDSENSDNKEKFRGRSSQKSLYEKSKEDDETLNFVKNMLEKFNISLETVKSVDLARNQSEFFKIKKVIDDNSRFLASIGIFTDKVSHFYIKEDVFVSEIMKNPQKIPMLLEPSTGVIRKICDSFGKFLVH
ncbi:hypothetical protein HMPREF0379_0675 [[Eubacterium] yurii subsp. margaretiae ATCC 43715]|nr:hypothetical protein HMPREF0379_0675 [[Eubacterium] yurii subsp. margaretiae ATCC 43715]